MAGVKFASSSRFLRATVTSKLWSHRGEHEDKPSNHCAGKAGVSPLNLYARVRFAVSICTRDRGCSAHPVFPASLLFWGRTNLQTSGECCRENADACSGCSPHDRSDMRVLPRSRISRSLLSGAHSRDRWFMRATSLSTAAAWRELYASSMLLRKPPSGCEFWFHRGLGYRTPAKSNT